MLKDRLKEVRKKAGMTQKQVANALGVTESTYCGYETGKRQPDAMKIRQLASVLGVSGDYLLDIDISESEKKPILKGEDGLSEIDQRLKELLQSLTEDQKRLLLAQMQLMKQQSQ